MFEPRCYALLLVLLSACETTSSVGSPPAIPPSPDGAVREPVLLRLDDFVAGGTLTLPIHRDGPVPAALLVHGSGPSDRDFSFGHTETKQPISQLGKSIADRLARHGIATLRYDKRYVRSRHHIDFAKFVTLDLIDLADDAAVAYTKLVADDRIRSNAIFVVGYDEGCAIAAELATRDDIELRGMVGIGGFTKSFAETYIAQYEKSGLPFLEQYAVEGKIDLLSAQDAMLADAGVAAHLYASLLLDRRADPMKPALDRRIDLNRDGHIDLGSELTPRVREFFSSDERLGPHSTDRALPALEVRLPELDLPILLLHGEQDGTVPSAHVRSLARLNRPHLEIELFPGLGHTLGRASVPWLDAHRPIESAPLDRLAAWLGQNAGIAE